MAIRSSLVYKLWAEQSRQHAQGYGATSFEGPRAYSYGTCIGLIVNAPNGENVYLIDTHRYSITTSKHQSWLHSACYSKQNSYSLNYGGFSSGTIPAHVLNTLLESLPEQLEVYKRARAPHMINWRGRTAQRTIQDAKCFARLFDLPEPQLPDSIDQLIDEMEEKRKKAEQAEITARKQNTEKILKRWQAKGLCPVDQSGSVLVWKHVRNDHSAHHPWIGNLDMRYQLNESFNTSGASMATAGPFGAIRDWSSYTIKKDAPYVMAIRVPIHLLSTRDQDGVFCFNTGIPVAVYRVEGITSDGADFKLVEGKDVLPLIDA